MKDELVYLVRQGAWYKIGRTRNLSQRLQSLRTGSPEPITVVFQLRTTESMKLETYLHRLAEHVRRRGGEWFRLSEAQLEMILALETWPLSPVEVIAPVSRRQGRQLRFNFSPPDPAALLTRVARRRPQDTTGHPVRQWREANDLTQEALAHILGMTQGGVSHLETYRRRSLPPEALVTLLDCTGLPVQAVSQPLRFLAEHPDFLATCKRLAPPSPQD